jgi:hypothetical protein
MCFELFVICNQKKEKVKPEYLYVCVREREREKNLFKENEKKKTAGLVLPRTLVDDSLHGSLSLSAPSTTGLQLPTKHP